jgi:hypothetical protein
MALTDNEREKTKKRTRRKLLKDIGNTRYSDSQKLEAIHSYLALGNLALTSRVLAIPEITLRKWKAEEWWTKTVEEIKMQDRIQLSARMKKIVEASQTIVAQRLETGDPILNQKTGEIIYKPVSMKDAHKVAVDLIDRGKELDKLTTEHVAIEKQDDRKLEMLAERFAEMATKSIEKQYNKQRTVDVEDVVEVTGAVYEEREARLQARESALQFEAGTDQKSFGENDSTS